jgi:rubredoxin
MSKWRCTVCDYVYDPASGDGAEVPPGTDFDVLPEDWVCPDCGVGKDFFEQIEDDE